MEVSVPPVRMLKITSGVSGARKATAAPSQVIQAALLPAEAP